MRSRWTALLLVLALATAAGAQEAHQYALSLFHFNIQYVAGGTIGFLPWAEGWDQTMEENEDQIVRESFEPVLDLYLRHPDWGLNLEMQGLFIEVLAARHPDVLEKLRTLAQRGQAEVVSFHYSDQFFLAYPYEDWKRSMDLARAVYEANGIPLGAAVFCQEGQAGIGMAPRMAEEGFRVMIWPKNLIRYNLGGDFEAAPYYTFGDLFLVAGAQGVNYDDGEHRIRVDWTFFDDGELLATGDMDPYFPPFFTYKPEAVAEYEAEVQALVDQGFQVTTVSRYVEDLIDLGLPPASLPPLLDGTWQPQSHTMWRWLGSAALWHKDERDNHVRTLCATAHRELVAAETALDAAEREGAQVGEWREALDEAWRLLALGEVTDGTGINPYKGEVGYALAHCGEALRVARDVIDRAGGLLGVDALTIDTRAGTVGPPVTPMRETALPQLPLTIQAPGRSAVEIWDRVADEPETYRVEIRFSASADPRRQNLSVTFPGTTTQIVYCPALQDETPVVYDRADFGWENYPMALANGLVGLGDDWYVIKDQGYTHIAAFLYPDDLSVEFRDETTWGPEETTWVFYLVHGMLEEAVEQAVRINVFPTVTRQIEGERR